MTAKFGRNYRMTIEVEADSEGFDIDADGNPIPGTGQNKRQIGRNAIIVEFPTTLQFNIERGANASYNQMQAVIYNLGEDKRNQLFADRFIWLRRKRVILEAGYGDDLSVVFVGDIQQASSARKGTDILTVITATDSGYDLTTTQTNRTEAAGTKIKDIIKRLIGDYPDINQSVVTAPDGEIKRPVVLSNNTLALLRVYTDDRFNVDLGQAYVLDVNEAIEGELPLINADSGLLETPRRDDANMSVTLLFEPRIIVNQGIEIYSDIQKQYNGQYKVIGIRHEGIISGAVNGQCTTTLTLLSPSLINTVLKIYKAPEFQLPSYAGDTPEGNLS